MINNLRSVNPTLDHLLDLDGKQIDKSLNGELFRFIALAIYAIAYYLRIRAMRLYLMVLGIKNAQISIKNDLIITMWNISGVWITVLINSILMQLCARFIYYKTRFPDRRQFPPNLWEWVEGFMSRPVPETPAGFVSPFRRDCGLDDYGDDLLEARST